MTPEEFKENWIAGGDKLVVFRPEAVLSLKLAPAAKEFLACIGLPEDAAPYLSFGDGQCELFPSVSEIWKQPKEFRRYRVIGSNGSGDPVCIDEEAEGRIVYLNHDDEFKVGFMNSSVTQLALSLLHFRQVVQTTLSLNGRDAFLDGNYPDFVVNDFINKMEVMDSAAIKAETFWFNTILNEGY